MNAKGSQRYISTVSFPSVGAFAWIFVWLCTLPAYVILLIFRTLRTLRNSLFYDRAPTQSDVVSLIINTSMFMLVTRSASNGLYALECNSNLVLEKQRRPFRLKSMRVLFSLENLSVHDFKVNGESVEDATMMMCALSCYFIVSHHTKIHCLSECIMKGIEEGRIEELYPSLFFTRALHTALLYNPMSPLGRGLSFMLGHFPVDYDSFICESRDWSSISHRGLAVFRSIPDKVPLCQFLLRAREICFAHTRSVGLCTIQLQEAFFLHTVVHAVDHHLSYKVMQGLHYPLSLSPGWYESFRGACFRDQWVPPILYPYFSNRMKDQPVGSVYNKIYVDLSLIDQELADVVTASIMY